MRIKCLELFILSETIELIKFAGIKENAIETKNTRQKLFNAFELPLLSFVVGKG
jgi:hypothetical protein